MDTSAALPEFIGPLPKPLYRALMFASTSTISAMDSSRESSSVPAPLQAISDALVQEACAIADASSPDLTIISASENLCRLLGIDHSGEVCGMPSHLIYHNEDSDVETLHLKSLASTEQVDVCVVLSRDRSGIECIRRVFPLFDEAGLLVFLIQMVLPTSKILQFSSPSKGKPIQETHPQRHGAVKGSARRRRRRQVSSETSAEREIIGKTSPGIEIPMEDPDEEQSTLASHTKFGLGSPSMPIMLQFKNLSYVVQIPTKKGFFRTETTSKRLLNGVSGFIAPGQLVAVMGSTGSGKTTLMNVLSGRVRRGVEGEILVNGKPRPPDFARRVAYVLQDDIFFSFLTVKQTLEYQAQLRLPASMSTAEKKSRANAMIGSMNLRKATNTIIGGPFKRGVSGGERKRVNIGNQLLAGASTILLDEPTSGLDTSTAYNIVRILKDAANNGYAVACSIHQPSAQMFEMFDMLMFLVDGQLVYFGPPQQVVVYLESLGFECPPGYNPIDFVMGLIIEEEISGKRDIKTRMLDAWESRGGGRFGVSSGEAAAEESDFLTSAQQMANSSTPSAPIGWFQQFRVLYGRANRTAFSSYLQPLPLIQMLLVAVIAGLLFLQTPTRPDTIRNLQGALFFTALFAGGFTPLYNALYNFPAERAVVMREQFEQGYSLSAYYVAKTASELPFEQIYPLLFVSIAYWMIGLRKDFYHFLQFLWIVMASNFVSAGLGLMISAVTYDPKKATTLATVLILTLLLVAGFYLPVANIRPWLRWLQYVSYIKYTYDALIVNQFAGLMIGAISGNVLLAVNSVIIRSVGVNIAILIGWGIMFRILAFVFLAASFWIARIMM
eukprot:TRINITY_DN1758_c0_g1_i1.p1 TRINITY_DN1758_c0_g1~~TRINITY_DN1758_c0_g1_i1.p1  ORF type:complete len:838 (-),score=94.63 TRINITY_DN1758_c0_g1_i1:2209-4722(-)